MGDIIFPRWIITSGFRSTGSATLGSPRGSKPSSDSELRNTKTDDSFFCIACRFLNQNKAKKIINARGHVLPTLGKLLGESVNISYKWYLCYMLFVICKHVSCHIYPFTVKIFRLYVFVFFFRFLKICEGGNPEATICFAVM